MRSSSAFLSASLRSAISFCLILSCSASYSACSLAFLSSLVSLIPVSASLLFRSISSGLIVVVVVVVLVVVVVVVDVVLEVVVVLDVVVTGISAYCQYSVSNTDISDNVTSNLVLTYLC